MKNLLSSRIISNDDHHHGFSFLFKNYEIFFLFIEIDPENHK